MTTLDAVDPRASAALDPAARERLETLCAQVAARPGPDPSPDARRGPTRRPGTA